MTYQAFECIQSKNKKKNFKLIILYAFLQIVIYLEKKKKKFLDPILKFSTLFYLIIQPL